MLYLIDGYNLMFRVLGAGDVLKEQRERLIHDLKLKIERVAIKTMLVFDSQHRMGEESFTHMPALDILFTAEGQTADDFILDWIQKQKDPAHITVVTSDKRLSSSVRRRGAKTESTEEFMAWLTKRFRNKLRKKAPPPQPKPLIPKKKTLSSQPEECFDYYLEMFEKSYEAPPPKPAHPKLSKRKKKPPKKTESVDDMERWLRVFEKGHQFDKDGFKIDDFIDDHET